MRDGFASATASAAALRVHVLTLYIQRALHLLLLSIKLAVHRRDATSPHDTTRCDETRRRTTVLRSADVLFRPDGSLWNGLQCIKSITLLQCMELCRFTFWLCLSLRLSLSPKFGLRPKISQKVKSFFSFRLSDS